MKCGIIPLLPEVKCGVIPLLLKCGDSPSGRERYDSAKRRVKNLAEGVRVQIPLKGVWVAIPLNEA